MVGLRQFKLLAISAFFTSVAIAGGASAATISSQQYFGVDIDRNDCAGEFGSNFESCVDPVYQSPIIAKYEAPNEGLEGGDWEFNTSIDGWGTVTVGMFTFEFDDEEGTSGNWYYDPGECADCPAITSYVVKGGNGLGFVHYYTDPQEPILSGAWDLSEWDLSLFGANVALGFSHISFYDTDADCCGEVPLPAGLPLVLTGLGVLGYIRRRSNWAI